ncbi:FAD-binding oxidoreductase [Nocardia terrae]|uniref:FAD-binding oxidoreductase n=1 Tax=Nocardia terrae TaxID=2675851 RepID=UPI001F3463F4|nr:FAD-binding oxidoreductase [Nocardia terrae]
MRWQPAELLATRAESALARTLILRVNAWPGHRPGQHVDVRLTAPDGYHAERSYSLAAPADGDHIEITVQRVDDGEVSPYLVDVFPVGAFIEVRGPVGGWFVWTPDTGGAAVLIAGGSGIVPLASMLRARRKSANPSPFRLLYSVRTPADLLYADELAELRRAHLVPPDDQSGRVCLLDEVPGGDFGGRTGGKLGGGTRGNLRSGVGGSLAGGTRENLAGGAGGSLGGGSAGEFGGGMADEGIEFFLAHTRTAPDGDPRPPGRLTRTEIARLALPPSPAVTCYVCGPTPFVEFAADALVSAGHAPAMIRTERFGPTGGRP